MQKSQQSTTHGLKTQNSVLLGFLILILAGIYGIVSVNDLSSIQTFTNVANADPGNAGAAIALSDVKDGGFAWGDINADGCLDLVVNTTTKSPGTRIFWSNCDATNPIFTDVTASKCIDCDDSSKSNETERSCMLADVNHDGYLDLITNGYLLLQVYANSGPPNYEFGTTDFTITSVPDGMNFEGVFIVDYDNDGWLDLVAENHNFGIDVFLNPADKTMNFAYVDPSITGLITSATDGDYGTALDVDDDGDIDLIARKQGAADFFINNGDGTFSTGINIADAHNNNKGGVVFADFDNDGDYDFYWTDNDANQIWENNGAGSFSATATGGSDGEPWASAGVSAPNVGIDGCAVGDVNNDGLVDLFLADKSGASYLFINQTISGGNLAFIQNNMGIAVNADGEGSAFGDYDNDGDLDLYINVDNKANQLWRNDLNDDNYLFVEPRIDLGSGNYRSAIGANVVIQDCDGNVLSGIREVPTTSGHGTDAPDKVHFGLSGGSSSLYKVVVRFVTVNGVRKVVQKDVVPNQIANQTLIIYDTDADNLAACTSASFLPVEWGEFDVKRKGDQAVLSWSTVSELNSDYFVIERSADGQVFEPIGQVPASGTTQSLSSYTYDDIDYKRSAGSRVFYKIKQVDFDGQFEYSTIKELTLSDENISGISAFPNPTSGPLTLTWQPPISSTFATAKILSLNGNIVKSSEIDILAGTKIWDISELPAGIYLVELSTENQRLIYKIQKR